MVLEQVMNLFHGLLEHRLLWMLQKVLNTYTITQRHGMCTEISRLAIFFLTINSEPRYSSSEFIYSPRIEFFF